MFSHMMLGTNNLSESIAFYDPVMATLGYDRIVTGETYAGYGHHKDAVTGANCLWIGRPFDGEHATVGNGVNVAFRAKNRMQVDAFYKAAIDASGIDEGAPGLREYHANFYACYVRDPLGNKLTVVCHEEK